MRQKVILKSAVSFWGGFDVETGCVAESMHPNDGEYCGNCELVIPGIKGSTAAPGALLEWFTTIHRPFIIVTPSYEPAIAIAVNLYNQLFANSEPAIEYRIQALSD